MPIATGWHSAGMLTNSCIQSNLRSLGRRVPPSPLAPRIGSAPKARNNACNAAVVEERRAKFRDGSGTAFCPILNGCWTLAGGHGREVFENIDEKLTAHAEAGFTTFDTADIYGPSETILGKFQKQWTNSGKPALQLFTKYVPALYGSAPGTKAVETAMQKSLAALQVPQLDLVQMHWWDYSVNGMEDTALVLTDLQAKGLIKSVGVTNIDTNALEKILDAGVPIVSNQVQFSLLDRRPLNGMTQLCRDRGIKLMTYGSLGGGLLSDKYVEEPRKGLLGKPQYNNIDLNTSSLKMYWQVVNLFGGEDLYRRLLLTLKSIADRHGVSVANVALKWVMSQGGGDMIYPIVGLRNTSHILDNARVFGLVLDQADFDAIADVLKDAKGPGGDIYSFERGYA